VFMWFRYDAIIPRPARVAQPSFVCRWRRSPWAAQGATYQVDVTLKPVAIWRSPRNGMAIWAICTNKGDFARRYVSSVEPPCSELSEGVDVTVIVE
jgi:hypothetical protein